MRQLRAGLFALAVCVAVIPAAEAFQYETFIDIEDEDDIWDLFNAGVIDEDVRESLLEIFVRGVNLNEASRGELYTLPNLTYRDVDAILAYREEIGFISDPAQLVAAGVLSEEKLLSIAAFLLTGERTSARQVDGWVRYQTRWVTTDDRGAPPMTLQARVFALRNLRVGFTGVLTQNRIGSPVVDPNRENALVAAQGKERFEIPKVYAFYDADNWQLLAGSYQIGFGQRLTFDNTIQYEPNGIYPDDRLFRNNTTTVKCRESAGELDVSPCADENDDYVTPDFRWRETLFGVAAGLKNAEVGPGTLQAYGFASYQRKGIYQYQLINSDLCENPRLDIDSCSSPSVFVERGDPLEPTSTFKFTTLPDMYAEMTAGGNLGYRFSRRSSLGITGYGSTIDFLTQGINLDFQDWADTPFGGPFGAVGVNGSWGKSWADVFFEVTRSFDSMVDGGGGLGSVVRSVGTFGVHEVEVSGRYYQRTFANPYARPISGPDLFEGQRARDEAGGRVRYAGKLGKRWNLRGNVDVWSQPGELNLQTYSYVRSDIDITDQYRWGLWAEYRQSILDGQNCRIFFGSDFELSDEDGNPTFCDLDRLALTGRFRYRPTKNYSADLQYRHTFYNDSERQDLSAIAILTAKLSQDFRLRGRLRWFWQDFKDNTSLEQSFWTYVDLTYRLRQRDRVGLRYDFFLYLDDRMSTENRSPNPEHWLWLQYEARF